ncbi:response regulator transcription factor [Streptomyces sp. NPDC060366]|uniref:response regulator transcription factor n=1 Tax=Streptomyces sp. NPDC060366 TaxID=3347105 RepID=UPI00365E573C
MPLTPDEVEVLYAYANGTKYPQIAKDRCLTARSVEGIAARIARKLGATSQAHAVLLACQAGILDGRPRRHGDHAGFAAHRARGEKPCDWCWEAEREYRAEMRRARIAAGGKR